MNRPHDYMHTSPATDMRRWPTDGHGASRPVNAQEPYVEVTAPLHWKPTYMTVDGAACGVTGVAFTGDPSKVVCTDCRSMLPTT